MATSCWLATLTLNKSIIFSLIYQEPCLCKTNNTFYSILELLLTTLIKWFVPTTKHHTQYMNRRITHSFHYNVFWHGHQWQKKQPHNYRHYDYWNKRPHVLWNGFPLFISQLLTLITQKFLSKQQQKYKNIRQLEGTYGSRYYAVWFSLLF